jgi:hypothetical protein
VLTRTQHLCADIVIGLFSHQFNTNDTIRTVNTGIVYCKRTQEEFGFHVASGKTGDWKSAPFVVFYNKEII